MLLIAGCAETPQEKAQRIEPMLAAAGFNLVPAQSPGKASILKTLPPLKLNFYINKQGHPVYWFADPYECNCLYRGNEEAYQKYQNLRLQQRMVEQEQQAAELNQDAAMQMNMFDQFFFP